MRKLFPLFLFSILALSLTAQKDYRVGCIAFYNLENLFDLEDDPLINDDDFTPLGSNGYTEVVYKEKLEHLSGVISEIGTELTPDGAAIVGVSEVENRKVLEDLVRQPSIADRNYQIVHYDSDDYRGIDVGLLYQPKYFTPTNSAIHKVMIYRDDSSRLYTRDVLYVQGELDGDTIHILVNHWPSRRGGQKASAPNRAAAATVNRHIADSIHSVDPLAKVIVMGDLNDHPNDASVKEVLGAQRKQKKVQKGGFYNPYYDYFTKGIGTTAWRDSWGLFDQIIVSHQMINEKQDGYRFYQANIFGPNYLRQRTGHFKGYPFRTYAGGNYIGGYSDHFPVYIYLVKEAR